MRSVKRRFDPRWLLGGEHRYRKVKHQRPDSLRASCMLRERCTRSGTRRHDDTVTTTCFRLLLNAL